MKIAEVYIDEIIIDILLKFVVNIVIFNEFIFIW